MALTIVFALASALLLSLTVIPVLSSYLLKAGHSEHEPWLPRMLGRLYTPVLTTALCHSRWVIVAAILMLAVAGYVYTRIGKTFMPRSTRAI